VEPGPAASADCGHPLPALLPRVCGGLDFLSAAAPGRVPGAFSVLATVPNADVLDFLVQIIAPVAPFSIKLPPPVPLA